MHTLPAKIFLVLLLLTGIHKSYGGDTLSGKFPKAVLVQLNSESNKIAAMAKARAYKELEEVKTDAANVRTHMMHDFTTNINYCPVYFFMDSNADLVKNKVFDGVLMNAGGSPVSNPVINSGDHDYVIVYYGYALSQSRSSAVVSDSAKYSYDPDSPPGKGLIILNDKFQQISYVFRLGYGDLSRSDKKAANDFYSSKNFEIEYFPLAKLFNERLNGKRGKGNRIKSARYHG